MAPVCSSSGTLCLQRLQLPWVLSAGLQGTGRAGQKVGNEGVMTRDDLGTIGQEHGP